MLRLTKTLFFFVSAFAVAKSQLTYPIEASEVWNETTTGVFNNNGVFIAPDDSIVVTITEDCVVRANNAMDGMREWTFVPGGSGFSCFGGVQFNFATTVPYLVFAVADDPFDIVNAST